MIKCVDCIEKNTEYAACVKIYYYITVLHWTTEVNRKQIDKLIINYIIIPCQQRFKGQRENYFQKCYDDNHQ